jgi:hypothetical protein
MTEIDKYAGERRETHCALERDDQAKTNMLERGEIKH